MYPNFGVENLNKFFFLSKPLDHTPRKATESLGILSLLQPFILYWN